MGECLLYQTSYRITDKISVRIPTVKEIIENPDEYYSIVALIVSTPYDMMVQLDNIHIDFTTINEWDLFLMLFNELQRRDTSLVFGDIDLTKFVTATRGQSDEVFLIDESSGTEIDRFVHERICRFLRKILFLEKNDKRPANDEAKRFMIDRARRKLLRHRNNSNTSQLEDFIISLVNTSEFSYDYSSVLSLTIYQFNASLHQIIKKVKFDNLMIGCYAGTVNANELSQDELNWISN